MLAAIDTLDLTGTVRIVAPSRAKMDLSAWNKDKIRQSHNCYSFALAALGAGWHDVGTASQGFCADADSAPMPLPVKDALLRDGFTQIAEHSVSPQDGHIIAAYDKFDASDFHIRHLGACGTWYEKIGELEADVVHENVRKHYNTANEVYNFAGFFVMPQNGIRVFYPNQLYPIDVLRRHAWRRTSAILTPR